MWFSFLFEQLFIHKQFCPRAFEKHNRNLLNWQSCWTSTILSNQVHSDSGYLKGTRWRNVVLIWNIGTEIKRAKSLIQMASCCYCFCKVLTRLGNVTQHYTHVWVLGKHLKIKLCETSKLICFYLTLINTHYDILKHIASVRYEVREKFPNLD